MSTEKKRYYVAIDHKGVSMRINSASKPKKALLVYDEKLKIQREIRYARNQKSIYVDEQKGHVSTDSIWMEDGKMTVELEEQNLQAFLTATPDNGITFREVDVEANTDAEIEMMEREATAMDIAKKMTGEPMRAAVQVLLKKNINGMDPKHIRRELLIQAKHHPKAFMAAINDPNMESKAMVQSYFDANLIGYRNAKMVVHFNLADNKTRLYAFDQGVEDRIGVLTDYLMSSEGKEDLDLLELNVEAAKV